jgi:hypothetical protein
LIEVGRDRKILVITHARAIELSRQLSLTAKISSTRDVGVLKRGKCNSLLVTFSKKSLFLVLMSLASSLD